MQKKTVLVTGGAGFVGSRLCARLLGEGHRVISLDNYFAGSRDNHIPGVDYREGHTKDIARLVPETPGILFHLGEYARVEQSLLEPDVVHDLNIVGTDAVVEYWKNKRCKLVYAGSSTKFGDGGAAREKTPYASTKARNTEKVKMIGDAEKLPYAITYFYNVYGPGERAGVYGTVIELFKEMYRRGSPISVTAPGTQKRNFTHVDDIVEGLMLVAEKGEGDEYGLGNERAFTMLEVAGLFGGEIVMLPPRAGNRMESGLDTSKSRALGWSATRSLEEYIGEFLRATPRGAFREKRVLVFSTTFFPAMGPAEDALEELMKHMPDVEFDIVTTKSRFSGEHPVQNARIHGVGFGSRFDKYMLPVLGFARAVKLQKTHRYLFAWSLMASYAAAAGVLLRRAAGLPLLITLADQDLERTKGFTRVVLRAILSDADQVYGLETSQEAHAANIARGGLARNSIGSGDAFANQLRYAYAEILLRRKKPV